MTIAEFLLARVAEDEARVEGISSGADPDFFWGPDRIRAECVAKRAIVEAYIDEAQRMEIYNRGYDNGDLTTQSDLRSRLASNARWAGIDLAARYLVQAYADHPDFNSRWLPENW